MRPSAGWLTAAGVGAVALLIALGLVVSEGAMRAEPGVRARLYVVFVGAALVAGLAAIALARTHRRWRSLRVTMLVIAGVAVVVASGVVWASTTTMVLDDTGLKLVLAALSLGGGLGLLVALSVTRPLIADLRSIAGAARGIAAGDLTARTEVVRSDEVGDLAAHVDTMARQLAALDRQRERSARARHELLTAIGHDLRTPLASLQAAIEALEDGVAPDPDRYLQAMGRDVTVLRDLVDDLFVLVTLESGDLPLDMMAIDLGEVVDGEVEAITPVAAARGVEVVLDSDEPLPVEGDARALGRALRNLLDNAVRHTPPDARVGVTTATRNGEVVVSVTDDGPGFPREFVDHAFERFSRADGARTRDGGGSGLGLAIAREFVEAHGGRIWIDPATRRTVSVSLPRDAGTGGRHQPGEPVRGG